MRHISLTTALECGDFKRVQKLVRLTRSRKSWACQVPDGVLDKDNNIIPGAKNPKHNEHLTKHFEEISNIYDTLGTNEWKKRGFAQVAASLRKCPYDIVTTDLAYRHLRPLTSDEWDKSKSSLAQANRSRLSMKMYNYVIEILETGHFSRLDDFGGEVKNRIKAWRELQQVHGVGPSSARKLFNKGYSTVAQLHAAVKAGHSNATPLLNSTQMIGLRHQLISNTAFLEKRFLKLPRSLNCTRGHYAPMLLSSAVAATDVERRAQVIATS